SAKKTSWTAKVTVRVIDDAGTPVRSATVSGSWRDGATGTASCTTNRSGVCSVTRSIGNAVLNVTFDVADVTALGLVYDNSHNTDPEPDSDGTTIIVHKP
ncbi:MAG: S8 family serine peptidase, partial [Gammaproteobacteria bacterium]